MRVTAGVLALSLAGACGTSPKVETAVVPHVVLTTTTAVPTTLPPRPKPRPTRGTVRPSLPASSWEPLIWELWGAHAPVALRVVRCESGGRPDAVGPQTKYGRAMGLFQVMNGPLDVNANITTAYRMWLKSGWRPWVSSRRCWAA